jgi:hypothetical protein
MHTSFCGEGPRSRSYGRTAALRIIVQPVMKMNRKISFFIFPSNGVPVEWYWQGKTEVLGEKPVTVPLCLPQITHGLTRDRTRRLTAWAMARPKWTLLQTAFKAAVAFSCSSDTGHTWRPVLAGCTCWLVLWHCDNSVDFGYLLFI